MMKYIAITLFFYITYGSSNQFASLNTNAGPHLSLKIFNKTAYHFQLIYKGDVDDANMFCNSLNMKLISVETEVKNDFLKFMVPTLMGSTWLEIYTSGIMHENSYYWEASGTPVTFTDWGLTEPNNHNNTAKNICLRYSGQLNNVTWFLGYPRIPRYAICESPIDGSWNV